MTYYNDYDNDYYPIDTPLTFSQDELEGLYDEGYVYLPPRPAFGLADPINRRMLMLLLFVVFVGGLMTLIHTSKNGSGGQPPAASDSQGKVEAAVPYQGVIAPFFTDEVKHWESKIIEWSQLYGVEPNVVATVMQIESCGDPQAVSGAGAQSLFQVMPFHFAAGENSMDPDTNAKRGMIFLADLLSRSNGDVGMALAGYNGGPGVMTRAWESWPAETQRYYLWGSGIYNDVINGSQSSETLQQWLAAGGESLCQQASARLGL
ncbi:MAG: lytic transglycosylase domain-containing protein [Candidatus Promineifilaceae bacterium]